MSTAPAVVATSVMPADLLEKADSGFFVLDITQYMGDSPPYLDKSWVSPLPGVTYRTVVTTAADGSTSSTTFLCCDPRVWAHRGDTFLLRNAILLAANPAEINQILAPDLPDATLAKARLTCYAIMLRNVCTRTPGDRACRHNGFTDTRRAGLRLPNLWSVGGSLPLATDVASPEAFQEWAQTCLNKNSKSVVPWYDLPLVEGSVAGLMSAGSQTTITPDMIVDAKTLVSRFMLGRHEIAASNTAGVNPVVALATAVVAGVANGSPACDAAEHARTDCPLFHQLGDNNPAANLALLRWLRDCNAAFRHAVIDHSLTGEELNQASVVAVTAILKNYPAPPGYTLHDTPTVIEDYMLDTMEWSVAGEFHAGATVVLVEVRDAFDEFERVAQHFAATTGYLCVQQSGDGSKTPRAARRLTLPEQPPVPDEAEKSSEGLTEPVRSDFIPSRSHLARSCTTTTLVGSTNSLPAVASSAAAGGGRPSSSSATLDPSAMASSAAPRTASQTPQELRIDRLEHNLTASFAKIFERLDASDSARAQLDAATTAAVRDEKHAKAELIARGLLGAPQQPTLAAMQTDQQQHQQQQQQQYHHPPQQQPHHRHQQQQQQQQQLQQQHQQQQHHHQQQKRRR